MVFELVDLMAGRMAPFLAAYWEDWMESRMDFLWDNCAVGKSADLLVFAVVASTVDG